MKSIIVLSSSHSQLAVCVFAESKVRIVWLSELHDEVSDVMAALWPQPQPRSADSWQQVALAAACTAITIN